MNGPDKNFFLVKYFIPVLLIFFLSACSDKSLPQLKVNVGQPFPELKVKDLTSKPATIQFNHGKASIINVWATWCGPCRYELPSLQRLQAKLDHAKFDVIGLSVDSDDYLVREYLIDKKILYPNFIDQDMSIANDVLGIRVYPSTYLVDTDGVIQEIIEGWREWDESGLVSRIQNLSNK